jgi:probable HAF family extracellular repeat protein
VALGPASPTLWADNGPYTVQDVGPANGIALGVNPNAAVVGAAGTPRTAFLASLGSGPQWLPGLVASTEDVALGVHPDGWAVGTSTVNFSLRPVSFQSGSAVDLAPLPVAMGAAHAVNDSGAIAGWVVDGGFKAVLWSGGSRYDVPGVFSRGFAVNNGGVVTGTYYNLADNTLRAFTWSVGAASPTVLASLGGGTSEGNGINDQGDVVGDSYRATSFDEIAALWPSAGPVVDLGTLGGSTSSARDINNHRQIVGYALNSAGAPRAFLSDGGAPMVDLNTLLEADSGWVLLSANAINDAGQIVGEGTLNGEPRAFLLTPPVASDTTPPVISSVTTTPNSVWPPRHQMVDVSVRVVASDDSGETPVCAVLSVVSSESDNADGDGNTSSDTEVVGPSHVRVRAERSGPNGARVYTVMAECTDGSGNAATGVGTVTIGESAAAKAKGKK